MRKEVKLRTGAHFHNLSTCVEKQASGSKNYLYFCNMLASSITVS